MLRVFWRTCCSRWAVGQHNCMYSSAAWCGAALTPLIHCVPSHSSSVLLASALCDSPAGPILDSVVWHDGSTWRVALDTSDMYTAYDSSSASSADSSVSKGGSSSSKQQGLLADFVPLADFAVERKHGFFSEQDGCAYAVKVYDEGNTLSIVVDAGAHGTHVSADRVEGRSVCLTQLLCFVS